MCLKTINQREPINNLSPEPKEDEKNEIIIKEIQEKTDEFFDTIISLKN